MTTPNLASEHSPRVNHDAYPGAYLRGILERTKTIAMVGASPEPFRPSNGVMRYLQRQGYRVIPVNPHFAGQTLHGERVYASLRDIPERIDMVNVFRRPDAVGEAVEDAIAAGAPVVWMQLGIRNDEAAEKLARAGIKVVQNRCIMVDHRYLAR